MEGGKEEKEKRGKEKRENGEEKKGNCKRGGGKLKGERYESEQRTFSFSFFFGCHFLKPLKFVWGVPKWKFLQKKKKKKIKKWTFSNLAHL